MDESLQVSAILEKCFENLKKAKWKVSKPKFIPPVSEKSVSTVEKKIGQKFPTQFRKIITQNFSGIQFGWSSDGHSDERNLVGKYKSAGKISFDPRDLLKSQGGPTGWIKGMGLTPSQEKKELKRWENKFPIVACETGDFITLDLTGKHEIHLFFHEGTGDVGNSYKPIRLAKNFPEFLKIWSSFGLIETKRIIDNFDIDEKKWKRISSKHFENSQILELMTLGRYSKF